MLVVLFVSSFLLQEPETQTKTLDFDPKTFFEMSPEMVLFLENNVNNRVSESDKLDALLYAIFNEDNLNMTYSNYQTMTPKQTFQRRTGNCLSFTGMFIAMARYCGLYARFQEVSDISSWTQHGKFTIFNRHMNAVVFIGGRRLEVDFNIDRDKEFRLVNHATDLRGIAHYYNNLGAECLANEDYQAARSYFEKSIQMDSKFSQGWTNLGVLERVTGNYQEAEKCYLKAQGLDRYDQSASMNLAHLYDLQGKTQEAEKLKRRIRHFRERNPYYHYGLGKTAINENRFDEAVKHMKKAVRLHKNQPQFLLGLAGAFQKAGKSKKAQKFYDKAKELARTSEEMSLYDLKLQRSFIDQ